MRAQWTQSQLVVQWARSSEKFFEKFEIQCFVFRAKPCGRKVEGLNTAKKFKKAKISVSFFASFSAVGK